MRTAALPRSSRSTERGLSQGRDGTGYGWGAAEAGWRQEVDGKSAAAAALRAARRGAPRRSWLRSRISAHIERSGAGQRHAQEHAAARAGGGLRTHLLAGTGFGFFRMRATLFASQKTRWGQLASRKKASASPVLVPRRFGCGPAPTAPHNVDPLHAELKSGQPGPPPRHPRSRPQQPDAPRSSWQPPP